LCVFFFSDEAAAGCRARARHGSRDRGALFHSLSELSLFFFFFFSLCSVSSDSAFLQLRQASRLASRFAFSDPFVGDFDCLRFCLLF
jgi:hypothetical protein